MVFFVRHGQSQANVDNVFAGPVYYAPLTTHGREQAKLAGEDLLQKNIAIDHIVASPIDRAKDTAVIIANTIGYDTDQITYDKRLVEYDMGELSGTTMEGVTPEQRITAKGAQDPAEFQGKVISCIDELKSLPGNTLVVSHAGVGRMIEATRIGLDARKVFEVEPQPNAKVVELL